MTPLLLLGGRQFVQRAGPRSIDEERDGGPVRGASRRRIPAAVPAKNWWGGWVEARDVSCRGKTRDDPRPFSMYISLSASLRSLWFLLPPSPPQAGLSHPPLKSLKSRSASPLTPLRWSSLFPYLTINCLGFSSPSIRHTTHSHKRRGSVWTSNTPLSFITHRGIKYPPSQTGMPLPSRMPTNTAKGVVALACSNAYPS